MAERTPMNLDHLNKILARQQFIMDANNEYWTEREASYRVPNGLDFKAAWQEIERGRLAAPSLPLVDQRSGFFRMNTTPKIQERLHSIDTRGVDSMFQDVEGSLRMEIIAETLIAEAFRSSQIEGAVTTFAVAEKLARESRTPRNKDEQMVLNNYRAMQWILQNRDRPMNQDLIRELHRMITKDAFEGPPGFEGRFREGPVAVRDSATDEVVYAAPPHEELPLYLLLLEQWANHRSESGFLHPVVSASVLHFYLVYVHPFYDGNGRTARALFYYSLLRHGYDSFRYLSISSAIHDRRSQYYQAIKRAEDERDLTPFVLFSCDVVARAIDVVRARLAKEFATKRLEDRLSAKGLVVNERQAKLLKLCLKHPGKRVKIRDHQRRQSVVYETARKDVLDLERKGLLRRVAKDGKAALFAVNESFFL